MEITKRNKELNTITVEMNAEALLHFLKFCRGIYVTEHKGEHGEVYGMQECVYCITLLNILKKNYDDVRLKDKIDTLRRKAQQRKQLVKLDTIKG